MKSLKQMVGPVRYSGGYKQYATKNWLWYQLLLWCISTRCLSVRAAAAVSLSGNGGGTLSAA